MGEEFTLAKPADEIFVFDLIKIFLGQIKLNNCNIKRTHKPEYEEEFKKKMIGDKFKVKYKGKYGW